jgi:hypothetical protein
MASNPYGSSAAVPMHKTLASSLHSAWSYIDACGRSYNDVTSVDLYQNVSAVQAASDGVKNNLIPIQR